MRLVEPFNDDGEEGLTPIRETVMAWIALGILGAISAAGLIATALFILGTNPR